MDTEMLIKISGVDKDYYKLPFGQQLNFRYIVKEFQIASTTIREVISVKGVATKPAIKKWIKKQSPEQYYIAWRKDSNWWKDNSVTVYYKM